MEELPQKFTVLVVDDNALNIRIITDLLKDYGVVLAASNGLDALHMVSSEPAPDLILLDIMMPNMDGYQVCRQIKAAEETKDIPVIFLTAKNDAANEEYGLSLGAIDYITKPFNPSILKARVKNHLMLKHYRDCLAKIGMVDGLTGIPNRRRFDETMAIEWRRAMRYGHPLSLIMADIDHFKNYNDTYGHLEGDGCLRKVATRLSQTLKRPGDMVGRWGGEEFACILPETDSVGAMFVAEELRKSIIDLSIPHKSSPVAPIITISLGVASMIPTPERDPAELIKHSDEALYTAKRAGRNRISLYGV